MNKRFLVAVSLLLYFVVFSSYKVSAQEIGTPESAAPSALAPVSGSGGLQNAVFVSDNSVVGNGSITSWKNAFTKSVTLTGTDAQCLEMRYTGEVKDTTADAPPYRVLFRATVDGVVAKGGIMDFDAIDPDIYTTTSMNWWICGLAAGTHTVRIQFTPYLAPDIAYVRDRTLIVEYKQ